MREVSDALNVGGCKLDGDGLEGVVLEQRVGKVSLQGGGKVRSRNDDGVRGE